MTTANIIPNPNLGFIKYWGMVTENVAVDNLLNFVEFKNRSTNRVEEIVAIIALFYYKKEMQLQGYIR